MDAACNQKAKATQEQWRKAKQACAEVEQRLGSIQRTTTGTAEFNAAGLELLQAYDSANAQVRTAQQATIELANSCFE